MNKVSIFEHPEFGLFLMGASTWKLTGKYGSAPQMLPPHLATPIREMPS